MVAACYQLSVISQRGWASVMLLDNVWLFGLALVVTLVTIPILRRIAVARDLYDRPDAGLKPHHRPIPYLGGVGIWLGWLVVLLAGMVVMREGISATASRWQLGWVAVGGSVLMLTGLVDDIRHLPPKLRLFVQLAVAGLLLYAGIGRGVWQGLMDPLGIGDWGSGMEGGAGILLNAGICFFVLAGATNSTNLIDGLDGLCAGILGIAAVGFAVMVGLLSALPTPETATGNPQSAIILVLSAAMLGACIGFLRYNFNPASMFMGDSGSLLLGLNVAVVIILMAEQASWRGLIGAAVVFGFPIFDTALAIARRWLNKRPLFIGDRSHFYDQLRDRGLSVRRTVLICYVIGVGFAAVGAGLMLLPMVYEVAVFIGGPIVGAVACWRLGMLRVDDAAEQSEGLRIDD